MQEFSPDSYREQNAGIQNMRFERKTGFGPATLSLGS